MNNAKLEELFEILSAACHRQFLFNPRRITAEMRYVGTEGHGKEMVHVFRDSKTHSQITLKNTFATLREKQGDKPHWSDAEKAHYKESDAQIDAQIQLKKDHLEYAKASPLYLDHRTQLLTHYKDSPSFVAGSSTPREAAKLLIAALSDSHDARLTTFAAYYGSDDTDLLAHHLLSPCHFEFAANQHA